MKILTKSDDDKSFLVRFNKKERELFEYQLLDDEYFRRYFDVLDTSTPSDFVITILPETTSKQYVVSDCIDYLNYVFANDMIKQMVRVEKLNKIKNGL